MDIILEKFQEWTKELDPINARISVFNHIRDIPYARIQDRNPETELVQMLAQNRGTCNEKHVVFSKMYEVLGIPTRYVSHIFRWSDLPVEYPQNIKGLALKMPQCDHLFCQAHIDGKWVSVDATWDLPLKKAGFPVTEKWDGFSDTLRAVVPLKEMIHPSLEERTRTKRLMVSQYTTAEHAIQPEFYRKYNVWLSSLRS